MAEFEGSVRPTSLYYRFDSESRLQDINPGYTAGVSDTQASEIKATLFVKLSKLQELLFVSGKHAVLLILQGFDSAGKDGAITSLIPSLSGSSVSVAAFKQPSSEELSHDFLWRYHKLTPAIGTIGIFNRSYYEAVLTEKFQRLVPEDRVRKRYASINAFEEHLTSCNTVVVKVFLHISKDEQKKRLMKREVERSWKLSATDWPSHDRFSDNIEIHNAAFKACSSSSAPWYIIPSNEKWFRDIALAQLLVDCLKPYAATWKVDRALLSNPRASAAQPTTKPPQRAADLTTVVTATAETKSAPPGNAKLITSKL